MNSNVRTIPARGQAWIGDWNARIAHRLRSRGFASVTDFAEAHPTWTTVELAAELSLDRAAAINRSDVAAEQVSRIWRQEAEEAGAEAVDRMRRRYLAGELCGACPSGWPADWNQLVEQYDERQDARGPVWAVVGAVGHWSATMGDDYEEVADRVIDALFEAAKTGAIRPGWLPAGADDPLLCAFFREVATEEEP